MPNIAWHPSIPILRPLNDCEAVALWLARNAKVEFGSDVLTIGGESAGAHLGAMTLLRMRDRHGYTGLRGANLVYGAYDIDRRDPDISPLFASC
ncbi:MAG TPA: alpha/beta hydrolase fold domain-containing protein [Acetobacteraceae bacterium]